MTKKTEVKKPGATTASTSPKKGWPLSLGESIVVFIFVVAMILLVKGLLGQLNLKHEVASARDVTNVVIKDVQTQNATAARSKGDKTFQVNHSVASLQQSFTSAAPYVQGAPTIVDQTVSNTKAADGVGITYEYNAAKKPFYVQVIVRKVSGSSTWQLFAINGSTSKSELLKK